MKTICPECLGKKIIFKYAKNMDEASSQSCPKCKGSGEIDDGITFDERNLIMKYVTFKIKDIKRLCPRGQTEFWSLAQRIFNLGTFKTKEKEE